MVCGYKATVCERFCGRPIRRPSGGHLPTVSEDDIFSAVGGLEMGHELDLAEHAAAAVEQLANGQPQGGPEPTRTLLVRGVLHETPDKELHNIFQARRTSSLTRSSRSHGQMCMFAGFRRYARALHGI